MKDHLLGQFDSFRRTPGEDQFSLIPIPTQLERLRIDLKDRVRGEGEIREGHFHAQGISVSQVLGGQVDRFGSLPGFIQVLLDPEILQLRPAGVEDRRIQGGFDGDVLTGLGLDGCGALGLGCGGDLGDLLSLGDRLDRLLFGRGCWAFSAAGFSGGGGGGEK
jgi:hypothetical protein